MVVIETTHWMFTILCVILLPWKRVILLNGDKPLLCYVVAMTTK